VRVVRLNTERAPQWRVLLEPGRRFRVSSTRRELASEDCAGVWWRRPEPPSRPTGVSPAEWEAIREQWWSFLRGLSTVRGPRWVSYPDSIARAESKAVQLVAARAAGFSTPETIWTNDHEESASFLAGRDTGVVKSVATAYWEEREKAHFVFARPIGASDLPSDGALGLAPIALQERISPKQDMRVTVVGDNAYAARLEPPAAELDWRLEEGGEWVPHELPAEIAERSIGLVRTLGLRFAGIDLIRSGERYVFVELNPNGEWGWLEKAGLPLAAALADELTRE
jgi:RimK-like ATP-grasp domain